MRAFLAMFLGFTALLIGCGDDNGGLPDAALADAGADAGTTIGCAACTTLVNGLVFDGEQLRPGAVVIEGDRIRDVVFDTPAAMIEGESIDVEGAAVLPGLIDLHVHLPAPAGPRGANIARALEEDHFKAMLRNGVTSFLDLGSVQRKIFEWRRRAGEGLLLAPRVFAVGPMFTADGGHPCRAGTPPFGSCQLITEEADIEVALDIVGPAPGDLVKVIIEAGFGDFVIPRIDFALLAPLNAAVEARGARLIAHVGSAEDMEAALDGGIRLFGHVPSTETLPTALVARAATDGAIVVPTLAVMTNEYLLARGEYDLTNPALSDDVAPEVIAALSDAGYLAAIGSPSYLDVFGPIRDNAVANVTLLSEGGVTIAAGTDAGNPVVFHGVAVREELRLYVEESGMTPVQALRAATVAAADVLGRDDLGRLEPGALADIVVVDGDPTVAIEDLANVQRVFLGGEALDLPSLALPAAMSLVREPVVDVPVDGNCIAFGECAMDATCDVFRGRCAETCAPATHAPCVTGDACLGGAIGSGICIEGDGCDLFGSDCPLGSACIWIGNATTLCWFGGEGAPGDSCARQFCAPGAQCDLASTRCYQLCDPTDADPGCPAAQSCTDLTDTAGVTAGRCQ